MNIAGLDIASTSGLAVVRPDDSWVTQTWRAPKRKGAIFDDERESTIDPVHTGVVIAAWSDYLLSFLIEHEATHVGIEMPLRSNARKTITTVDTDASWAGKAVRKEVKDITSMATIFRLYGMSAAACAVCRRLNIPAVMINQSEHRKAFLGNGSPKDAKDAAMKQCQRLRIPVSSKDSAEAVGVAWCLRGILAPQKFRRAEDLFRGLDAHGTGTTATL